MPFAPLSGGAKPGAKPDHREAIKTMAKEAPRPQLVGDPLVDEFRKAVMQAGGRTGFRGLMRVFKRMDKNGNGTLSESEFQEALVEFGIAKDKTGTSKRLFNMFDRDRGGSITTAEFVKGMRPPMSAHRRDLVLMAHRMIDHNLDGKVTLDEVARRYDVSGVPDVIAGIKTEEEALKEFTSDWDRDGDGVITKAEFVEYYEDLAAGIHSDQYFELMIRNAWHISGGEGVCQNTTCLRVLVTYTDGRSGVVEVKDDLGLDRSDIAEIRRRLQKQGIRHIQDVSTGRVGKH